MSDVQIGKPHDNGRRRSIAIGVALVGLVATSARLLVVEAARDSGLFSDMVDYHVRAQMLVEGKPWPDSFRGPGYPIFLWAAYSFSGVDVMAARIGNAVLGGIAASLTSVLALQFVALRGAIVAGLAVALYPASLVSSVYVMPESLYGVLLLGGVLAARALNTTRAAVTGVLAGAATLTRSLGVSLLPVVLLGHVPRSRRPSDWLRFAGLGTVLAMFWLLMLVPWFRHTTRVSGGLMLDSASAYNVLLGANPRARERLDIADGSWVLQTYFTGTVNEADRNTRALRESWKWIRENPAAWLKLMPLKMAYLFGLEGREHAWAYSNTYFGARSTTTARIWGVMLIGCFPPIAILAVIGLLRPGLLATPTGVHIAGLLAATTLMHGISFSETRYHLPLVPLLSVLAVRAAGMTSRMSGTRWSAAFALIAGLAAGWWRQLPELLNQYAVLTAEDGWKTGLPF